MKASLRTVLALCLCLGAGCAGRTVIRPTTPFTPEMAQYFDDSVDYVTNVENLGGRLAADLQTQLNFLSRNADLVSVVRIETVTVSEDAENTQAYRLSAVVVEPVKGTVPEDNHVNVRAVQGQPGYNTVQGRQDRLQSGRWILFAKWYTDGAGELRAHWHLYPHSDAMIARVRQLTGTATSGGEFRTVTPTTN